MLSCFAFPERLLLLWLLVPVFMFLVYGYRRKRTLRARLADEALLDQLAGSFDNKREIIARVLCFFAIGLLLFAMTGPQWCSGERLVERPGTDVVFVLDVSSSMRARDEVPDRLTRAKQELDEVSDRLGKGRRGLVAFAGSAALLCPLTSDREAFSLMLDIASTSTVELQGTDLGRALRLASATLAAGVSGSGTAPLQVVVVASDGEDHGGGGRAAAEMMAELGQRVFVIGVGGETPVRVPAEPGASGPAAYLVDAGGEPVMSRLEPLALQDVAKGGNGELFTGREPLGASLADLLLSFEAEQRWVREPVYRTDLFHVFLFPALVILIAARLTNRPGRS